ncbi:MAG TPA: hypothetical protein VFX17_02040 [Patescibacteria group bacterium]|nr:hypothetical protein [Patescibacteria group bacterium]
MRNRQDRFIEIWNRMKDLQAEGLELQAKVKLRLGKPKSSL